MFDIKEITSMIVCDLNGNKICDLGGVKEIQTPKFKIDTMSPYLSPEINMSISDVIVSEAFLKELGAEDRLNCNSMTMRTNRVKYVQNKKNKNNRINKKWLKKYGYKEVIVPFDIMLDDCKITQNGFDSHSYGIEATVRR